MDKVTMTMTDRNGRNLETVVMVQPSYTARREALEALFEKHGRDNYLFTNWTSVSHG